MCIKKKIILITSSFPFGGASANLLRYFSFCLNDGGFDIEIFLPTGGYYGNHIDQTSIRKGEINGVRYKRLGLIHHPKNYFGKLLDKLLGLIVPFFFLLNKKLHQKLDVVIVYNPTLISYLFHYLSRVIIRFELIIIIPEFYEKPSTKFFSISTIKWYNFYFGIKYLAKYADKFIVLSSFLEKYVRSRLKSNKKIMIMPNLTDSERFNILPINIFKEDFVTIGYVGTPTRKDGVLDLIDSFSIINKKYPKTHLLIIGDITNGNTIIPKLKEFAISRDIDLKNITFTGLTSHSEIPQLLLSCQILALTRPAGVFAEAGFPTKLGEYFACKKPVVITRVGDMKIYFKDKEDVVFADPENIPSIVSAFEFLILNPDKSKVIGINGYKWMCDNLNYINQTKKISDFVNKNQ